MPIVKNLFGKNGGYKTTQSMRNVIDYALKPGKTETQECAFVTGLFTADEITTDTVYDSFMADKIKFNKLDGRQVFHTTLSWHPDELDSQDPADQQKALEYSLEFVKKINPRHQALICVHTDKDHLHTHIIWNSVSAFDGKKINERWKDTDYKFKVNEELSKDFGFKLFEKGKHFDGTPIEPGTIRVKNSYEQKLLNEKPNESFMANLAKSIVNAKAKATSKEEFIELLDKDGWKTSWVDNHKIILFTNKDTGKKVRNTTLGKRFTLNISKEDLENDIKANHNREASRDSEKSTIRGEHDKYNERNADPNRGASTRKRRRRNRKQKTDEFIRDDQKRIERDEIETQRIFESTRETNTIVSGEGESIEYTSRTMTFDDISEQIDNISKQNEKDKTKVYDKTAKLNYKYSYTLLELILEAILHSRSIYEFIQYLLKNKWKCTVGFNNTYRFQHEDKSFSINTKDLSSIFNIRLNKVAIDRIIKSKDSEKEELLKPFYEAKDNFKRIPAWSHKNQNKDFNKGKYKDINL